jgi:hypothetical protein
VAADEGPRRPPLPSRRNWLERRPGALTSTAAFTLTAALSARQRAQLSLRRPHYLAWTTILYKEPSASGIRPSPRSLLLVMSGAARTPGKAGVARPESGCGAGRAPARGSEPAGPPHSFGQAARERGRLQVDDGLGREGAGSRSAPGSMMYAGPISVAAAPAALRRSTSDDRRLQQAENRPGTTTWGAPRSGAIAVRLAVRVPQFGPERCLARARRWCLWVAPRADYPPRQHNYLTRLRNRDGGRLLM